MNITGHFIIHPSALIPAFAGVAQSGELASVGSNPSAGAKIKG
jgi:hypothetical protein